MQNIRIGVDVSRVPVGVNDSSPDRCPSWKIHTMAPNVADRLSRFRIRALTGITTLPEKRNSITNVITAIIATASGRRPNMALLESTSWADDPVTRTRNGAGWSRISWTRCSPLADIGSTFGTHDSHVPPPPLNRARAGVGGGSRAPPTD